MTSRQTALKEQLLSAVAEGRLSVEALVDTALGVCREDTTLLGQLGDLVAQAETMPQRRVYIRQPLQLSSAEWEQAMAQVRAQLLALPDVLSVGWGRTYSGGKGNDDAGVIVRVAEKRDVAAERRIPSRVKVQLGERDYEFRVDVKQLGELTKQRSVFSGTGSVTAGDRTGTLSACVEDSNGSYRALLSGHVARGEGVRVEISAAGATVVGVVGWHRDDAEIDAAAVRGIAKQDVTRLRQPEVRLVSAREALEGLTVKIHGAASRRDRHAQVEGTSVDVDFVGARMHDLIELDQGISAEGDSGAPAFDSLGRLVGFVVGTDRSKKTHLISARKVIRASEA